MKTIALIGRPNVGKSTLYNRLTGKREALVDDQPGVTRDRRMGKANIGPYHFEVTDTPGLEEAPETSLEALMTAQSWKAVEDADVLLFIFDAVAGLTAEDEYFARLARKSNKPTILVANKSESKKASAAGLMEAYQLGLGSPVAISAEHGEGMNTLLEALLPFLDEEDDDEEPPQEQQKPLKIAIVGRPNVGKSTLVNALLGEDRVLVGPYAGMTRDAVRIPFTFANRVIELADTAGMRRKAKIDEKLEAMSVKETTGAIRFAEVVVLVLDATQPLEKQDNTIAALIEREGRACVVALNKWDLVKDKKQLMEAINWRLENVMPQMKDISVVPMSALKKEALPQLMKAVFKAHELWNTRLDTSPLNRWLEAALAEHTPPMVKGRRFKIRYITQVKARPPTFILFVNNTEDAPESYIRYLANGMRERFKLPGVPLRIQLRAGKNPYAGKEKKERR